MGRRGTAESIWGSSGARSRLQHVGCRLAVRTQSTMLPRSARPQPAIALAALPLPKPWGHAAYIVGAVIPTTAAAAAAAAATTTASTASATSALRCAAHV